MLKGQVLDFVLKNWKVISIVSLLLVVILKTRYDYHLMESAYTTMLDSHKEQISGLKEIHEQEMIEKQLLLDTYLETLDKIEKEHKETLAELKREKQKRKKEYIKKFSEDKEALVEDIEATFGFEYVSP